MKKPFSAEVPPISHSLYCVIVQLELTHPSSLGRWGPATVIFRAQVRAPAPNRPAVTLPVLLVLVVALVVRVGVRAG